MTFPEQLRTHELGDVPMTIGPEACGELAQLIDDAHAADEANAALLVIVGWMRTGMAIGAVLMFAVGVGVGAILS